MLDLLRRREMPPARRQIGDRRHVWVGDHAAFGETDALLALSLERGACHRLGYVADARCRGKREPRARVR